MLTMSETMLREISIAYVVENKDRDKKEIYAILAEVNPFADGEVVSGTTELSVTGTTPNGDAQEFKIKVSNAIRATWSGDGTNRISPPDVRRGEKIMICQYSNVDKFYWKVFNQPGINTRKRETIIEAISNTTDENVNELTAENSWYKEFSTHDKRITVKTNKSDGEQWAYTMQLDAKTGNVVVADDIGNYFQMNSADQSIELETATGGRIALLKRVLTIDVDTFNLNAKQINYKSAQATYDITEATYNGGNYTYNPNVAFLGKLDHLGKSIGIDHKHVRVKSGDEESGEVA